MNPDIRSLTVFHDPSCGLCCRFRVWLDSQPKWVAVEFIDFRSAEAERRLPGLRTLGADKDVVVLADDGRWWQGDPAWLTCLWATREWRPWSHRLAAPVFRPLVRKAVHLLAENRLAISRLLHLPGDAGLAAALTDEPAPHCADEVCERRAP